MNNCKSCKNAIFNELWGDYKCKIDQIIHHPDEKMVCEHYKKGIPSKSKKTETHISR